MGSSVYASRVCFMHTLDAYMYAFMLGVVTHGLRVLKRAFPPPVLHS